MASAVNLAEVQTKLIRLGWARDEAWEDAISAVREILPFDSEQARIAGDLAVGTQRLGLSLGDRACLALGKTLHAPIYTTERAWQKLKLGATIHVIR